MMKNVAKVILSTTIGLILWLVFGVLFMIALVFLLGRFELFAALVDWLYASKLFGHLVPLALYAIPCILPAWVVNKLHHGDGKVRKAAQWTMCGTIVAGVLLFCVMFEGTGWFAVIEGLIGTVFVFAFYAKESD